MAGAAPTPQRGSRRRSLDAAINVVPFIDLLSCCISFLIITAAWSSWVKLSTRPQPSATAEDQVPSPPQAARPQVTVDESGYVIARGTETRAVPKNKAGEYDPAALATALADFKKAAPDQEELLLRARDRIPYREVVRAMDAALAAHFPQISVGDD